MSPLTYIEEVHALSATVPASATWTTFTPTTSPFLAFSTGAWLICMDPTGWVNSRWPRLNVSSSPTVSGAESSRIATPILS